MGADQATVVRRSCGSPRCSPMGYAVRIANGGCCLAGRVPASVIAIWLLSLAGCAGYQIGQQTMYRPDIRTIHVPVFESVSFRRHLGERLTEAVATEIELKTPYRVVSAERADSVLRGRIVLEEKRVIAEDQFDIPRVIETDMVVQVEWIGSQGDLLANAITIPLDQYDLRIGASEQFIPEGGQSLATAHQEVIQELAEQIVAQMEVAPW